MNRTLRALSRRSFLTGLGGVVIPLPLFDFFVDGAGRAYAQAATAPKRFIMFKSGLSPAADSDTATDITGGRRNLLTPLTFGANYRPSPATLADPSEPAKLPGLDSLGLQPYVSFVSNCTIPFSRTAGGLSGTGVPAGGCSGKFHQHPVYSQVTGRRCWNDGREEYSLSRNPGPSADQLIRAQLNPMGRFKHANYMVQAPFTYGREMQFGTNGQGLTPDDSPKAIFASLFGSGVAGGTVDPAALLAWEQRKSVLDLIDKRRLQYLNRELGKNERAMLTAHLDQIRELELRVTDTPTLPTTCKAPPPVTSDPGRVANLGQGTDGPWADYMNEDLRADLIVDMLAMAISCDLVRHGTIRMTADQSFMDASFLVKKAANLHNLTHFNDVVTPGSSTRGTTVEDQIKATRWVVGKFFRLAAALQKLPQAGGNILDSSALVFIAEGGFGPSMEGGTNVHSTHNMMVIVAGKAGGALKGNVHLNGNGVHPGGVLLTAMKAVGYSGTSLGDVTATVGLG